MKFPPGFKKRLEAVLHWHMTPDAEIPEVIAAVKADRDNAIEFYEAEYERIFQIAAARNAKQPPLDVSTLC